jgi:PAS domain S-box-containing protein
VIVNEKHNFLSGGGEMGALMRAKDWSKTNLGTPEDWPQSLRTSISIILNSKFPMFLFWGSDLICFYNDAYRPSLGKEGKHPDILGSAAKEYWQEIWDIIKPLIDQVLEEGVATWSEDQLIPIFRNGKIEDVYWTFSYSPVMDESGKPAGVFVTCVESTGKVIALQELEESKNQLQFAIEAAELGTWDYNPASGKFTSNLRLKKWFGLSLEDEIDLALAISVIVEKDQGRVTEAIKQALCFESRGDLDVQFTIVHPRTKQKKIVRAKGKVLFGEDRVAYRFIGTLQDITEEKRYQQQLEVREQKFRVLADSMPDHVWTANTRGNFNYFNQSLLDYCGLTNEQLLKEGWLQIVHPDDREKNSQFWEQAMKSGENFLMEHRFRGYDGEYCWHLSRAIPQKDSEGKIQMWVGTSTDIQKIKELDTQKDQFLSMASHELRTPLTSIKGYIQMLQKEYSNGKDAFLKSALDVVNKQINILTNLTSELLELSKIQSGNLNLNKESFELNQLVTEIIDQIHHIDTRINISFTEAKESLVYADRQRIGQVLTNFFTNAIKYSPDSNEIIVKGYTEDNRVVISVKDFGIGISRKDQRKIFERFYRVEGKNEKTFPGIGIGLSIASEIIQRHNGKIWVDSVRGAGSVFYFSIPVNN